MINLILFLLLNFLGSYPIDPIFINNLCDKSDVIVEAKILTDSIYRTDNHTFAEATLHINKKLKGEVNQEEIVVTYNPGWSCPEGPSLKSGKNLITFLSKRNDLYHVYGMSYGTKYFKNSELRNEYLDRIKSYLEITKENEIDSTKIIDWLIENLDHETTFNESTFIINGSLQNQEIYAKEGTKKSWHYKENIFPITRLWDEKHKTIIRNKIIKKEIPSRSYSWKLLCHLYDPLNKEFENLMIETIDEYLEKELYHGIKEIVKTINFNEDNLIELKRKISSTKATKENYEKLNKLTTELSKLINN